MFVVDLFAGAAGLGRTLDPQAPVNIARCSAPDSFPVRLGLTTSDAHVEKTVLNHHAAPQEQSRGADLKIET